MISFGDPFSGSFGGPPPVFSMMFTLITTLIVGVALFILGRGVYTWMSNNACERITKPAFVVSKRTRVSGGEHTSAHTSYYVTFEFDQGERREFHVRPGDYGLLAEGDQGQLSYQGTRFLEFQRSRQRSIY
ncbi:DUF2500 domain-containing protein [Paenibacillus sp. JMULE4]|nr:DUF2500 domain-containing protein [Paenibacillus sp. JMULE4]NTZ19808.1 DUF2500 domain-containing protein [Paenibacillus sp. JMULE4]